MTGHVRVPLTGAARDLLDARAPWAASVDRDRCPVLGGYSADGWPARVTLPAAEAAELLADCVYHSSPDGPSAEYPAERRVYRVLGERVRVALAELGGLS